VPLFEPKLDAPLPGSIVGEKVKRSALALVVAAGLVVLLRNPVATVIKQLRGTVVRTEHRSEDGGLAHAGPEPPSL